MLIEPPIDKLILKTPCRYALVAGIAKRARELNSNTTKGAELEANKIKPITYACNEVYDGSIEIKVADTKEEK